jgi:aldose 1-epimerase
MTLQEAWQHTPVYTLENEELAVSLCPSLGNNLYRIWDKRAKRDVLRAPERPELLRENPGQYGTPLMLPPGRIRNGRFQFDGRDYQLDINTPDGHHMHGFLRNHPWTFAEDRSNETTLVSVLDTAAFPSIRRQYPHPLTIEVAYILEGSMLIHRTVVTNRGETAAPFGYGLHTWFRLDRQPEMWSLHLPVSELWEPGYRLLPHRELVPLGELSGLLDRLPLQGIQLDHVFRIGNHPRTAILAREGYELHYSASHHFLHWIVYTNGKVNDFICLEPITWVPNAPNLDLPAELTGLRAVAPRQTLELEVRLELLRV